MVQVNGIEIRPLRTYDELVQAEDVQRIVWKMDVDTSIVPASILQPIGKNGGVVLGAFDGPKLVGFCCGFMGRTPEGQLIHWSHMNGVLPDYEGRKLGEELKWAQREAMLAIGINLVRWTTDPLEGRPPALNFGKLGVTCRTYDINTYGAMPDGLNAGIESDRFIVDWELDTERVRKRRVEGRPQHAAQNWEKEGAQLANLTERIAEGVRRVVQSRLDLDTPHVLIEPPASYQKVKLHDLDLAVAWRMQTRELLTTYFGRGYVVTEFASEMRDGERRNFYLLEQS